MTDEIRNILQRFMASPTTAEPRISPGAPPSLDEELSRPMPQFEYQPQKPQGGIRGLLAALASGVGHGAGSNSVGGALTGAYEGNMQDAERRRQLDYQRQAQQYKNVYGAEEDRRANLVRMVQQKRAQAEADARRAHEGRMEGIATDRAGFDMAQSAQKLIEDEDNRTSADERARQDRELRRELSGNVLRSLEKRNQNTTNASRANAAQRTSNRGEITPAVAVKQVQDLENKLAAVNAQIAAHKNRKFITKGKNFGKQVNPADAQGGNPEINPLWNRQKALKQEISQWRNWMARFGQGVPPPSAEQQPQQVTPQAGDPILSLFSDLIE